MRSAEQKRLLDFIPNSAFRIPHSKRRFTFCCTFPFRGVGFREDLHAADGGRYPPSRPVEPGLSSPEPKFGSGHPSGSRNISIIRHLRSNRGVANSPSQLHHDRMTVSTSEKFGPGRATATIDWREAPPAESRQGVVAVGNFDGVHRGHAALVDTARSLAGTSGSEVVTVVTFDPHPLQLLHPERFQPPLTTIEDRAELLHKAGADAVVILKTDADMLKLDPSDFFRRILVDGFAAKGLVEGFNFRFGHDRAGSVETLRQLCAKVGIAFQEVEPFQLDGVTVSSSKVRDALVQGNMAAAIELLGRHYRISGTVVTGAKRGRTIGFPTANLEVVKTLLPAEGVYAVRAVLGGPNRVSDRVLLGAANIGPNPTFGENARKIEVHLIDFTGDLYGQTLALEFIQRLRETRPFKCVEELVQQLGEDVAQVRMLSC